MTEPVRKPARKPAAKKSTTAENPEKPRPAAVKSTSARTAPTRTPARKTAVTRAPAEEEPPKPSRRRAIAAKPVTEPVEPPVETVAEAPEPAMTRGILELAAERLAASQPREPQPEPPAPAGGDPMAAPGAFVNPRATGGRRPSRSVGAGPAFRAAPGGTRPGVGSRPTLTSRPPAGPPEAVRPSVPELAAVRPPAPEIEEVEPVRDLPPVDLYPRTANRRGLPPSLRLPAELPDNLWPPKSLLDRNLAENIHVPARVEAWPEPEGRHHAPEFEAVTEERIYVPPAPEPEPDFLPVVLSRPEPAVPAAPELLPETPELLPEAPELFVEEEPEYVPAHSRSMPARHAVPEATSVRRIRRRRRAVLVAYVMVVLLVLVVGHELWNDEQPIAPGRETSQTAGEIGVPAETAPAVEPTADKAEPKPEGTAGQFRYERSRGPMLGDGGRLYRFRVAVEEIVEGTSAKEFAETIDATLGDDRSWVHDGSLRLRRVAKGGADVDFTVYLASAKTSEKMCATGGLDTEGYTSCRVPGRVIINSDRWAEAVPEFGDRLQTYRRYAINHEVGHELGHGHEACPGKGEPAPVMQQQTFGLKGCTPNPWPYLDGERYDGEPVA
ncbi:DUF3152 domain-containing protein [Actinoplanes sp. G11-F43]|uniref:DUF3152 domain-containing protein n=1 Tax=Actinoplanes sp. G11-F43 TaxID=3424130 RepID=UPI003D352E6E